MGVLEAGEEKEKRETSKSGLVNVNVHRIRKISVTVHSHRHTQCLQ